MNRGGRVLGNYKVKSGFKVDENGSVTNYINITDITMNDFEKFNRDYVIAFKKRNKTGMNVTFKVKILEEIINTQKKIKTSVVTFQPNENGTWLFLYKKTISVNKKNLKIQGDAYIFPLSISEKNFHMKAVVLINKDVFKEKVINKKKEVFENREKDNNSRSSKKTILKTNCVLQSPISKPDVRKQNSQKKRRRHPIKPNIYESKPNTYRQCSNCFKFNGSWCDHHHVDVEANFTCKNYYWPSRRIFQGGGFSPR